MKKQKMQLIIILVLLAVFAAGYFGLKHYNKVQDDKASKDTYTVLTLDKSAITEMKITNTNGDIDLVKKDDTWVLASDESQKLDQDTISTMLEDVEKITANNKIDKVTDFDQYGLKTPSITVTVTTSDGKQTVVNLGSYSEAASRYYCRIGEDTTVYLVASEIDTAFNKSSSDLAAQSSADSSSSASDGLVNSTIAGSDDSEAASTTASADASAASDVSDAADTGASSGN